MDIVVQHGTTCHYCGEVLTIPINITDVYDYDDIIIDVSVEADMRQWWAHIEQHKAQWATH